MGSVGKQRKSNAKGKPRGKPFEPGNTIGFKPGDPRINRTGIRTHGELRELIQALASEDVKVKGETMTRLEAMLFQMFRSRSPADRQNILEHGWGKVPQAINLTVDDELRQLGIDPAIAESDLAAAIAAGTEGDAAPSDEAGESEADRRNPG